MVKASPCEGEDRGFDSPHPPPDMKANITIKESQLNTRSSEAANESAGVLLEFDKLPNNPDENLLARKALEQLERDGYLTFAIFTCLDWQPSELLTTRPERFLVDKTRDQDLFTPRIKKINQLQERLAKVGISSRLIVVMGDTDMEEYFNLILQAGDIYLNQDILSQRKKNYIQSFNTRLKEKVKTTPDLIVWSDIQNQYNLSIYIPNKILQSEVERMKQAYLFGRNFQNLNLKIDNQTFEIAARRKIEMYARQGKMIEETTGAILLQSEIPWLEITQQLRLAGSEIITIYPWVRKEEQ